MDFEAVIKVIVAIASAVAIPVAAYAAIAATRAIWVRPARSARELEDLEAELDALRSRVAQLETAEARLGELEERLDFAERLLVRGPDRGHDSADTPPDAHPAAR
ncbi:MAG TPA: hypothetical protein VMG41_11350 [Gemmatimonadales bacterium]|nr:hypothetical protein [Gemmatimonadales bacterium]